MNQLQFVTDMAQTGAILMLSWCVWTLARRPPDDA